MEEAERHLHHTLSLSLSKVEAAEREGEREGIWEVRLVL